MPALFCCKGRWMRVLPKLLFEWNKGEHPEFGLPQAFADLLLEIKKVLDKAKPRSPGVFARKKVHKNTSISCLRQHGEKAWK